jgi:hypothetical protein
MYNPISIQFLHNLKESLNSAHKECIAPLVGRLAPIFLAVENVEKRGARDPAGWSGVSVMCVAQEFSLLIGSEPFFFYFGLSSERCPFSSIQISVS